jgi:prolyl oligopeptidase
LVRTILVGLLLVPCSISWTQSNLPSTPVRAVTDSYFDVKVTDNYRWLEAGDAPEVKEWVTAQNAYTAAHLEGLPQFTPILDYEKELLKKAHTGYSDFEMRGGRLFGLRTDPGKDGVKFVVFSSPEDKSSERQIVDTASFIPEKVFQVDWYNVSPDGKLAGLALSAGGSEDATLYVVDTATGKPLGDEIPHANFATAGGDMAWKADASGFFYTRYPQENERPAEDLHFYQRVFFHTLGTPMTQDRYVLGKEFPRIAEVTFVDSPDSSHQLIHVANGDGGDYEDFVVGGDGQPKQVTQFSDKVPLIAFGTDNSLWLLSHKNSDKGEMWHLPADDFRLGDAKLVVKASDASLEGSGLESGRILLSRDKLYLTVIDGGPEQVRAYTLDGKRLPDVPAPKVASVSSLVRDGGDGFLYSTETYTTPQQWYWYEGMGEAKTLPFREETNIDLSDIAVKRVFAISKDGTRVPLTILMREGTKLDGKNPALITGYGGYDISLKPYFNYAGNRLLFDHGGVFAIANLRGGAEYGESWHTEGNLTKKQNVFDDFAACAQYLVDEKYTSPEHLAAEGGSNGGLLMGAMITQHPELFRVVISYVGIYDMLRTELDPNGTFNTTEYGTVKNKEQFQALYAYSPYHHVVSGAKYPSVLFITGDNDHRVNPAHSRKMLAELQAATGSGRPVLLLTNANAGHGISTDVNEAIVEDSEVDAFLFSELGIPMQ